MNSVSRLDQAVLLLRDRLEKLGRKDGSRTQGASGTSNTQAASDEPLRRLARDRSLSRADLRKAVVRCLLAEALGAEITSTLAFQSIADEVASLLERDPAAEALLTQALAELGV